MVNQVTALWPHWLGFYYLIYKIRFSSLDQNSKYIVRILAWWRQAGGQILSNRIPTTVICLFFLCGNQRAQHVVQVGDRKRAWLLPASITHQTVGILWCLSPHEENACHQVTNTLRNGLKESRYGWLQCLTVAYWCLACLVGCTGQFSGGEPRMTSSLTRRSLQQLPLSRRLLITDQRP